MCKSTHFIVQPLLGQLLSFIDQADLLRISKEHGGERYVKHFDSWHHLVTMLYATIMRFDSLREIQASITAESRKLSHLVLTKIPRRSTLSDANKRRPERSLERYTPHSTINTKEFFHRTAEIVGTLPVGLGS